MTPEHRVPTRDRAAPLHGPCEDDDAGRGHRPRGSRWDRAAPGRNALRAPGTLSAMASYVVERYTAREKGAQLIHEPLRL